MTRYFQQAKELNAFQHIGFNNENDEQHTQGGQLNPDWYKVDLGQEGNRDYMNQEDTRPTKRQRSQPRLSPAARPASPYVYPPPNYDVSALRISPSIESPASTPEPDETAVVYTRTAGGRWLCTRPPCIDTFSDKSGVKRHVRTVHEKRRDHVCEICGWGYSDPRRRIGHLQNTNPKYEACHAAWIAGTVPGAPGYVAPPVVPALASSTSGFSGPQHSASRAKNVLRTGAQDDEYSHESGLYAFDPLACEEQQTSFFPSWSKGPATGSRYNGQGSPSDGNVVYPATLPRSAEGRKQEQAGGASGSFSRMEPVQRSDGRAYTASPPFYSPGEPLSGPFSSRSQWTSQVRYTNESYEGTPHASQAGQPDFPLTRPPLDLQVPGGMFGVLVPPSSRSNHRQHQPQAAIRGTNMQQYSSLGYNVPRNNIPATGSLESRQQAYVPSQHYGPDSGNLFPRASPYFPASNSQIPGYRRAAPIQQQNVPHNEPQFAQSVQNEYAWGTHQQHGRSLGIPEQPYTSPYSSILSSRQFHNHESLTPSGINTGPCDQPQSTSRVLGKRKERSVDESFDGVDSFPQALQQDLIAPPPSFNARLELESESQQEQCSLSTPDLEQDDSLESERSDESEVDDETSSHGFELGDVQSSTVPSSHNGDIHIPPVLIVNRHARYRAKTSTIGAPCDGEEFMKACDEDDPLEAWRKMVFGGK